MSTQSTQYNSQQAPYDELRKTSIAIIERVNIPGTYPVTDSMD